jgi:hypothetical protein
MARSLPAFEEVVAVVRPVRDRPVATGGSGKSSAKNAKPLPERPGFRRRQNLLAYGAVPGVVFLRACTSWFTSGVPMPVVGSQPSAAL